MYLPLGPEKPKEPVIIHKKYTYDELCDNPYADITYMTVEEMGKVKPNQKLYLIQGTKKYGIHTIEEWTGPYHGEKIDFGCGLSQFKMGVLAK